jgi:hypothetical protein
MPGRHSPTARPAPEPTRPDRQVRDWYVESFRDLRSFPSIKDGSDELKFTEMLRHIYRRYGSGAIWLPGGGSEAAGGAHGGGGVSGTKGAAQEMR